MRDPRRLLPSWHRNDDVALTPLARSWHDEAMQPVLGLISHGTSSPDGKAVILALAEAVAAGDRLAETLMSGPTE